MSISFASCSLPLILLVSLVINKKVLLTVYKQKISYLFFSQVFHLATKHIRLEKYIGFLKDSCVFLKPQKRQNYLDKSLLKSSFCL